MRHLQLLFIAMFLCVGFTQAQDVDVDALKAMMAEKQAAADALAAEAADIQGQIDALPGWEKGGFGTIGFNGLRNNNWFALPTPNSQNAQINLGAGGFANYDNADLFWNNSLNINVARAGAYGDFNDDATKTVALTNNGLDLTSLFGKKISPKFALSGEFKLISTVLEFFANGDGIIDDEYKLGLLAPGQATFSLGATWLPIKGLTVNLHPLAYQKNWPGNLKSMAGCKFGASYAANILPNVGWTSNLSGFLPYGGAGDVAQAYGDKEAGLSIPVNYSTGDLANWQWINSFTTKIWKGIGVKFDLGLGANKQVADSNRIGATTDLAGAQGVDTGEKFLQSYYGLGLGYQF